MGVWIGWGDPGGLAGVLREPGIRCEQLSYSLILGLCENVISFGTFFLTETGLTKTQFRIERTLSLSDTRPAHTESGTGLSQNLIAALSCTRGPNQQHTHDSTSLFPRVPNAKPHGHSLKRSGPPTTAEITRSVEGAA